MISRKEFINTNPFGFSPRHYLVMACKAAPSDISTVYTKQQGQKHRKSTRMYFAPWSSPAETFYLIKSISRLRWKNFELCFNSFLGEVKISPFRYCEVFRLGRKLFCVSPPRVNKPLHPLFVAKSGVKDKFTRSKAAFEMPERTITRIARKIFKRLNV